MASGKRVSKKAKPAAPEMPAPVDAGTALAGHPTCEALLQAAAVIKLEVPAAFTVFSSGVLSIRSDVLACSFQEFQGGATDQGGIRAFDLTEFRATMKQDGEYTCTTIITSFQLLGFAHKTIAPNLGRVDLSDTVNIMLLDRGCCGVAMQRCDRIRPDRSGSTLHV